MSGKISNLNKNLFFEHISEQIEAYVEKSGGTICFALFAGDSAANDGTYYWSNAEKFDGNGAAKELRAAVEHLVEQQCHG